jgi:predicted PurR-regulated permease PerM
MPRGFAILVSFLALIGLGVLVLLVLVPIPVEQLSSLIRAAPDVLRAPRETLLGMLESLSDLGFLLVGCFPGCS